MPTDADREQHSLLLANDLSPASLAGGPRVPAAAFVGLWLLIPMAIALGVALLLEFALLAWPPMPQPEIDPRLWLALTLIAQYAYWTLVSQRPVFALWALIPLVALVPTFPMARAALERPAVPRTRPEAEGTDTQPQPDGSGDGAGQPDPAQAGQDEAGRDRRRAKDASIVCAAALALVVALALTWVASFHISHTGSGSGSAVTYEQLACTPSGVTVRWANGYPHDVTVMAEIATPTGWSAGDAVPILASQSQVKTYFAPPGTDYACDAPELLRYGPPAGQSWE